jgi:hypothetical protein
MDIYKSYTRDPAGFDLLIFKEKKKIYTAFNLILFFYFILKKRLIYFGMAPFWTTPMDKKEKG